MRRKRKVVNWMKEGSVYPMYPEYPEYISLINRGYIYIYIYNCRRTCDSLRIFLTSFLERTKVTF